MNTTLGKRTIVLIAAVIVLTAASTVLRADTNTCSGQSITLPFVDVAGSPFFCNIAEAYFTGLTNGTSETTYDPGDTVTREQMAAFVTRTLDQSIKRGSKRASLDQFWTGQGSSLGLTTVGSGPELVKSDGADLWVANLFSGTVSRVRASDGAKLGADWTGATLAFGVLAAAGKIYVTGSTNAVGHLYVIDPAQPAGAVTVLSSLLGASPRGIAFDGQRIWTANLGSPGSVSIISLDGNTVTNCTTGFSAPQGIVFDGANIWVTDTGDGKLKKLDSNGNVIASVTVGSSPRFPMFDGTNIWVPNNSSNSITVVRATGGLSGNVLATLTGNGLNGPQQAAFDGERVLVTGDDSISLWKATDLSPITNFSTGTNTGPFGVCSNGLNFWISLGVAGKLARF